jgi:hypothetical protein
MTRSVRIVLAVALLLGGVTFAMAQNGPDTRAYPPGTKNPNLYGYYGDYHYYARPRYAPYYREAPYYILGYPVVQSCPARARSGAPLRAGPVGSPRVAGRLRSVQSSMPPNMESRSKPSTLSRTSS